MLKYANFEDWYPSGKFQLFDIFLLSEGSLRPKLPTYPAPARFVYFKVSGCFGPLCYGKIEQSGAVEIQLILSDPLFYISDIFVKYRNMRLSVTVSVLFSGLHYLSCIIVKQILFESILLLCQLYYSQEYCFANLILCLNGNRGLDC